VTLEIKDYVSFYTLPSAIMQANAKYSVLDAAYLFYYASDVVFGPNGESRLKKRLEELVTDAMIIAAQVCLFFKAYLFGSADRHISFSGKIRCLQCTHIDGQCSIPSGASGMYNESLGRTSLTML